MKQLIPLFLLLLLTSVTDAQSPIPEFGKIDKAELEITSCDFDKDAEAVVLFDEGEFYYEVTFGLERHVRIKILKDKGLEMANVHIKYYSFNLLEDVKGISAQTYNLDAAGNIVVTKLEKKQIYDKKLNKRYSEMAFSFPEVKVGSIIEYKYRIEGADNRRWFFQQSIPVIKSRYIINFPPEIEMSSVPHCILPYQKTTETKSGRYVDVYTMENVPALRNEAYISCDYDYLQSIEPRLIAINPRRMARRSFVKSWPTIINDLMEDQDFGFQLKKNIPRTKDLDSMLAPITSLYEKMIIIHKYVRKNMEWSGYDNIWALEGVKSAWKDKKGTSGEINLILVNLLKDAGLNAHPILVSTRDHGRVNTFVAGVGQFNKVMAYVELGEDVFVLDAVEKFTPAQQIPMEVLTSNGLLIKKNETDDWGWRILWNEKAIFKNSTFITADIDKNGMMKGAAEVLSEGYARIKKMPVLQEGRKVFIEKIFTSQNKGINIDSVSIENEKNDTLPLLQKVFFNEELNSTGEYKYFSANLFSGLEKNPFIEDNRFSDIFFGYNQKVSLMANVTISDNYQLEELPKNIRLMMPDTGIIFTRFASVDENRLSVRVTLEFKKPVYSVDEYPEFKEFYKKLFDLLNEQFVLRKKN